MTTTTIADVLARNPADAIPNTGVAKVGRPTTPQEWSVLRHELTSFVWDGEYAAGIERILQSYLVNLGKSEQPAVWVSGFYGSGKSHLVRVLEALWADTRFPDGATARGLVNNLPPDVDAQLRELSTRSRSLGVGTWAAAGQLSGDPNAPKLPPFVALLGLLFRATGMPDGLGPGSFALWLKEEGVEEDVKAAVAARGGRFEAEVTNLFVARHLPEALVEVMPGFASSAAEARQALRAQFPSQSSLTDLEALGIVRRLLKLASPDKASTPLTLIVIDELQQYVSDDSATSLQVQNLVEACSARFDSRLLVVATGQSALSGTSNLQKLQGRFPVRVQLSEKDVHAVIGNVVLQKRPDQRDAVRAVLDKHSAEVDRQLRDTRIAPSAADRPGLVDDYPLLPARHRLWEAVLREIDRETGAGQARSQLKVVQETTGRVAARPLGWVIPTDALFDTKQQEMLQTALLSPGLDRQIADQAKAEDGELRARLLKMIFLIGQLPTEGMNATGVKATPDTLADLLVQDLVNDGPMLRERIPTLLGRLVVDGLLQEIDGAFSLQTREGQEWTQTFRNRLAAIRNDDTRIAGDRDAAIKLAMGMAIKGITILQGTTKEKRDVAPWFQVEPPPASEAGLPVWIRDEWSVTEKTVQADAREAGVESPVVFVFLTRRGADELRDALADIAAAQETVDTRPAPVSEEARKAREAMDARRAGAERRRDGLVQAVLRDARVVRGGGTEVIASDLASALREALDGAATRRYPRFGDADQSDWAKVVKRANDGHGNPMQALGWEGEVAQQPVCAALLGWLGQPRTGGKVRAHFSGAPYGWPRDAIDGGLLALVADGQILASVNGTARTPKQLVHQQIGQTEFVRESQPLSMTERITLAAAIKPIVTATAAEITSAVPSALAKLDEAAQRAGGDSPLPPVPAEERQEIAGLRALAGQQQLRAAYDVRDQLASWHADWTGAAQRAQERMPRWRRLEALLARASDLSAAADARVQAEAIRTSRSLLDGADPTGPLIDTVAGALRASLQDVIAHHLAARNAEVAILKAMPEWNNLGDAAWSEILAEKGLGLPATPSVGTEHDLVAELDRENLATRAAYIDALPTRAAAAREEAARRLQPEAVKVDLEHTTLTTVWDVEAYIRRLEVRILAEINAGRPVIV